MSNIHAPRPLLPGDEVWFMVLYYTRNVQPCIRWQQSRVVSTDFYTVSVRYYETPHHEVRKVLRREQVHLRCPGEPLFSS
jgi:hypothetical protein